MASIEREINANGETVFKVTVSDGRGRRIKRSFKPESGWSAKYTERELQKFASSLENQLASGELLTRKEAQAAKQAEELEKAKLKTLRQYADGIFMPTKELSLSENGRSSYRQFLDLHILPTLGDFLMTDISSSMLTKLLVDFQQKGYAQATCVKLYNILNGVFQMAFLDDTILSNPMLKVSRPKPSKDDAEKKEELAYTVEELRYVLRCADREPLKWRCFIHLLADSGMRRGECCALQWEDIDFKNETVTVRHNLQYTKNEGIYLTSPKNGRVRVVDIGPDTLNLLRELRISQAETAISSFVFTQDNSPDPIHPQSPTRYFKRFGTRYNVPDFHPHKLRHTAATIMILNGADITSVSERLGHQAVSTTADLYSHANRESIRRAGQIARDAIAK